MAFCLSAVASLADRPEVGLYIEAGYPTGRIPEGFPDQRNSEALKEALLNTRKLKDRQ